MSMSDPLFFLSASRKIASKPANNVPLGFLSYGYMARPNNVTRPVKPVTGANQANMLIYSLYLIILLSLLVSPAFGAEPEWFLLSREDGCLELELLVKREKLPKAPATPEEFAEMMRERGYHVTLGLPEGFPAELSGKVVLVKVRENMAPVFVREEICRQIDK